jgi:hypothetical protein
MKLHSEVTARDLYPNLSDRQLEDAEDNLRQYLAVILRIAERLHAQGQSIHNARLTESENSYTIPHERSNQRSIQQQH